MRTKIVTLCLILACCAGFNISYGAFVIKEKTPIVATEGTTTATETESVASSKTATAVKTHHKFNFAHKVKEIKAKLFPDVVVADTDGRPGWPGIVSFICGIVACVAFLSLTGFLIFSLGAFIFGIIGLGAGYKYHLLAIIGLVIGAIALLALLL